MNTRSPSAFVAMLLLVSLGGAGCVSLRRPSTLESHGMAYQVTELTEPRLNRAHVLRINLARGKVRPAVVIANAPSDVTRAEAMLTNPLTLAADPAILAFVNTNPWDGIPDAAGNRVRSWIDGQPVDIHGLAASGGRIHSPARSRNTSVWFDRRGRVHIGGAPPEHAVVEGVAGFAQIVENGSVVARGSGRPEPRTALGVDPRGRVLWLVVVDGRQPGFSEGMTYRELARFMLELGCWNAVNLDGGGSSVMGLVSEQDGALRVVNSPSDRVLGIFPRLRPLPMILTFRTR